jgi:serine/threonine-protein kinase
MATESLPERAPSGRRRPELEPRRGLRLGRYELLAPLASGGMAQVWIARLAGEHGFERLVAIKTMRPEQAESDSMRRMFLDEARIAARITHTNVVEVLDLGDEEGIVYQAMPLVEGESIAALLRRRKQLGAAGLPAGVAARVVADVLCGLHAAHELTDEEGRLLHLVHRDVSPQNVLVGVDGVAKIADFGVAKARWRLADETEAGQVKGKFGYMAPEQLDRRSVDRRSDVFSMGVVLWETLVGQRLFGGIDVIDTIAKLREARIPDPRTVVPSLPAPLAEVAMHALARDPRARFATAAEMSDAVDEAARVSGVAATTKEVGTLVADLCADELERRRESVRDAVRAVTRGGTVEQAAVEPQPVTATTTIADERGPAPVRSARRMRAIAGVGIGTAAAVGIVAIALAGRSREGGTAPAAEIVSRVAISASAPAAPVPPSAQAPAAASASAAATAPASASATATATVRPRRPYSPPTPRVKYGNPYGP